MVVGDKVRYSKKFLQAIGEHTGDMPAATGVITELQKLSEETTLAIIEWDRPDIPRKVNTSNLSTLKQIQMSSDA